MATTKQQRDTLARLRASGDWPAPTGEPRIYRIIRFRMGGTPRTVRSNVTLTEAQAHCRKPETHGTDSRGRWFDGYDYMRGCAPKGE